MLTHCRPAVKRPERQQNTARYILKQYGRFPGSLSIYAGNMSPESNAYPGVRRKMTAVGEMILYIWLLSVCRFFREWSGIKTMGKAPAPKRWKDCPKRSFLFRFPAFGRRFWPSRRVARRAFFQAGKGMSPKLAGKKGVFFHKNLKSGKKQERNLYSPTRKRPQ